jgi:long-chain acyl-CoA synthetase
MTQSMAQSALDLRTLNDILLLVAQREDSPALLWRDPTGQWQPITARQVYHRVRALAHALQGWGVGKGDRVAILAENRWEWAITDFAVLALGAIDVPLYATLTPEQIAAQLADCGAKVIVVSSEQQVDKVLSIRARTALEKIVVMDAGLKLPQAIPFADLMPGISASATGPRLERDAEFDRRAASVQPQDPATIIYTSGTTGESKGVLLTHGNIASNLNHSTTLFGWGAQDICISFLPLSHITARHLDYALFGYGATLAYCPQFDLLPAAMREVRPTIFVAVPRVYEKIRQEVLRRAAESPVRNRLLHWALARGAAQREIVQRGQEPASPAWKLANRLAFAKIRGGFGGRVQHFISGGAPLSLEVANWFLDAGIRIFEGYGLTETSPVIALNNQQAYRPGSVGRVLPNIEVKLAADGELLVRGPSIFTNYWNKPQQTAEAFTADGWFQTGDIAHIDAAGFLFITDRKKELLKTSGGKLIAPQPIEGKLKANVLVGQACVVGDRHKFAAVLLSPNFIALEAWARAKGISAQDRAALVAQPQVQAEYKKIIDEVNATLARFETLKRFHLVAEEWTLEGGELTPSMKLKRRVVLERYAQAIAAMYADEDTAHG